MVKALSLVLDSHSNSLNHVIKAIMKLSSFKKYRVDTHLLFKQFLKPKDKRTRDLFKMKVIQTTYFKKVPKL